MAQSPDLPKSITETPSQSLEPSTLNVIARLCNSNPVKEALPPILRDIQRALGIEVAEDDVKSKKRKRAEKEPKPDSRKPAREENEVGGSAEADDESIFEGFGSSGAASSIEGGDEDEDNLDLSRFDARLADSEYSEDDLSGSDEDLSRQPRKGANPHKLARQLSISPSLSPSPEPARQRPTKSAFIPSLTTGYISGSGSDIDSDIDTAPRKNRRGQRARQLLAEKKFGNKAKHLQDGHSAANKDRSNGWDAKKGATDSSRGFGRGGSRGGRGGRGGGSGGFGERGGRSGGDTGPRREEAPKPKHRDDEGALHPSWAAAKKAKEAKVAAPFQGKRITFD